MKAKFKVGDKVVYKLFDRKYEYEIVEVDFYINHLCYYYEMMDGTCKCKSEPKYKLYRRVNQNAGMYETAFRNEIKYSIQYRRKKIIDELL